MKTAFDILKSNGMIRQDDSGGIAVLHFSNYLGLANIMEEYAQEKLSEEKYQNTLLAQKCSDLADELNEAKGLANALIDDYTDLIRICTAIYKWRKESVKEMINQSTSGNDFEKFKNHLGI